MLEKNLATKIGFIHAKKKLFNKKFRQKPHLFYIFIQFVRISM
jgi:hypothetical protein